MKIRFYHWAVECNCIANLKELHERKSIASERGQNNRINSV